MSEADLLHDGLLFQKFEMSDSNGSALLWVTRRLEGLAFRSSPSQNP